jgi:hypothetical protein
MVYCPMTVRVAAGGTKGSHITYNETASGRNNGLAAERHRAGGLLTNLAAEKHFIVSIPTTFA